LVLARENVRAIFCTGPFPFGKADVPRGSRLPGSLSSITKLNLLRENYKLPGGVVAVTKRQNKRAKPARPSTSFTTRQNNNSALIARPPICLAVKIDMTFCRETVGTSMRLQIPRPHGT